MKLAGKRVLVIGARGMLAADVIPLLAEKGAELSLADLRPGELCGVQVLPCDLTRSAELHKFLDAARPEVVLNLAAYTAVDAAEKDYHPAFAVNGMGPAYAAAWTAANGAVLVHISTDYVFGGDSEAARHRKPFREDQQMFPCGIYGESKRMGEEMVRAIAPGASLIVRTSWLHGLAGPNFVDTIRRAARERAAAKDPLPLRVVNDQFGSPTWSVWLGEVLVELIERGARGTFHASSRGDISWYDFAQEIVAREAPAVQVLPQTSAELSRPAPRPAYSTLDLTKLESLLGRPCPGWKTGLEHHLRARNEAEHV
jgi:dTDP-4-dehydrorhamnose reductase